ncbi:hypothetical protein HYU40_02135 [Candidatus Woesearchaeota archaeon]|nr:hypothetical protein [Candidatus Woesearchaeota archaeon]
MLFKSGEVIAVRKKSWYADLGEDSLEVLSSEIEDLENDELSVGEAGFISGYELDQEYEGEYESE